MVIKIFLRNGSYVFLPPGSECLEPRTRDNNEITYVCPDGDIVKVDFRNDEVRNESKNVYLGRPMR
jgi:hypothetical protein